MQDGVGFGVGFGLVKFLADMNRGLRKGLSRLHVMEPCLLACRQHLVKRRPVGENKPRRRWWWGYDGVVLESRRRLRQVLWGEADGGGCVSELNGWGRGWWAPGRGWNLLGLR